MGVCVFVGVGVCVGVCVLVGVGVCVLVGVGVGVCVCVGVGTDTVNLLEGDQLLSPAALTARTST